MGRQRCTSTNFFKYVLKAWCQRTFLGVDRVCCAARFFSSWWILELLEELPSAPACDLDVARSMLIRAVYCLYNICMVWSNIYIYKYICICNVPSEFRRMSSAHGFLLFSWTLRRASLDRRTICGVCARAIVMWECVRCVCVCSCTHHLKWSNLVWICGNTHTSYVLFTIYIKSYTPWWMAHCVFAERGFRRRCCCTNNIQRRMIHTHTNTHHTEDSTSEKTSELQMRPRARQSLNAITSHIIFIIIVVAASSYILFHFIRLALLSRALSARRTRNSSALEQCGYKMRGVCVCSSPPINLCARVCLCWFRHSLSNIRHSAQTNP